MNELIGKVTEIQEGLKTYAKLDKLYESQKILTNQFDEELKTCVKETELDSSKDKLANCK